MVNGEIPNISNLSWMSIIDKYKVSGAGLNRISKLVE
jgi:hypothetical protein